MKEKIFVQTHGTEKELTEIKAEAKKHWKEAGNLLKDIKTLNLYVKPHENMCYYTINEEFSGSVALS